MVDWFGSVNKVYRCSQTAMLMSPSSDILLKLKYYLCKIYQLVLAIRARKVSLNL